MIVWELIKRGFGVLWRLPVPLLICLVVLAGLAIPTTLHISGLTGKLKKSEAAVAKLDKANASLKSDLATCNANVDGLSSALETQNRAVDQLKAESDARTRRAQAAIAQAQKQARGYRARIKDLERMTPGENLCASARNLISQTLSQDR